MKYLLLAAGTCLAVAAMPTDASAYYCRAKSANASSWGRSGDLAVARRLALVECAIRTAKENTCFITYCNI